MVKVLIKGAGDLASGVAMAFYRCGFQVLMTEIPEPTVIRRSVAFASCVYDDEIVIEGVKGRLVREDDYQEYLDKGLIGVIVDPKADIKKVFKPDVIVDAILAKRNLGTKIDDAPIVIGCGPGFTAGEDCNMVIETKRGHDLGKVIRQGRATENTGIPGIVDGRGLERVLYSPIAGKVNHIKKIGDIVEQDDIILKVGDVAVKSPFKGVLRGLIIEDMLVPEAMKIGDVDPRGNTEYCFSISEKAMAIGRGAVEAALQAGKEKSLFGVLRYE